MSRSWKQCRRAAQVAATAAAIGASGCAPVDDARPPPAVTTPMPPSASSASLPAAAPVGTAGLDPSRRAEIARAVASRQAGSLPELTKADLRPPMHAFVPLLGDCYRREQARDPQIGGVVNTRFVIESEPGQGTIFTVRGFDTAGALGQSSDFRACVTATAQAIVLPPIGAGGRAEVTYPITFAPEPPDNHDTAIVDEARRAAAAARWDEALTTAERGLERTSLDGTFRRQLIEVAGVGACHLRRVEKARHYDALASATAEPAIREACAREGIDLRR